MTNEEAIITIKTVKNIVAYDITNSNIVEAFDMAVKALENDKPIDILETSTVRELNERLDHAENDVQLAIKIIAKLHSRERVHGTWIDTGSGQECSICHEIQYGHDNFRHFCANCGAGMLADEAESESL